MKTLLSNADAIHFLAEAFKHCKPIGLDKNGSDLIQKSLPSVELPEDGISTSGDLAESVEAIKQHPFGKEKKIRKCLHLIFKKIQNLSVFIHILLSFPI